MNQSRGAQRREFLTEHAWQRASLHALPGDASFRRYFRLQQDAARAVLMDAPPPEDAAKFVRATSLFQCAGARVPKIFAFDAARGFILLEDLGDATMTELLRAGEDEAELYRHALRALFALQRGARDCDLSDLPAYDFDALLAEAMLLVDWYLPSRGVKVDDRMRRTFTELWRELHRALPHLPQVLVHRDFHVDNLILHDGECAMLDYQDALLGSPAYDLVSLLQDARRDVDAGLQRQLAARFTVEQSDTDAFAQHFAFWAAQRHAKVAGIFVRLHARDAKPHYLPHLPRVLRQLKQSAKAPGLAAFGEWLDKTLPD